MCDERQCKRQPNNDYCHCEDHYMQMSNADCAPRSNTGCTPYQLEALENMCKMSCKENPLEYLIRAEANERAQATEADGKTEGKANSKKQAKPSKEVEHNEKYFKTTADPTGLATWQKLAEKLNVKVSTPITIEEKNQIVKALKERQQTENSKNTSIVADGLYGIKSMRFLESTQNFLESDSEANFNKRLQNIKNFTVKDGDDPQYAHRHARYLTEFMTVSDKFTTAAEIKDNNIDQAPNGEQVPYSLVRRMILDDLVSQQNKNIGLLSLWIGTAEWGVNGVPKDIIDPVYKNSKKAWHGPDAKHGKRTREYEQGGVGIADFDSELLLKFYEKFGMPDGVSKDDSNYVTREQQDDGKVKYNAKAYNTINNYHEWYEYISKLFDRGDGTKVGDEWNDEASIWIMETWLKDTWKPSIDTMNDHGKAAIYSRMKNSANVVTAGGTAECDSKPADVVTAEGTSIKRDSKPKKNFKKITQSSTITDMEDQYVDFAACQRTYGNSEEKTRKKYKSRLQFPKRIQKLIDHVQANDKANHFTVSEDGAHVLDQQGNIVD